jgi:hypothetical protein
VYTLAVSVSLWLTGFAIDEFQFAPRTIVLILAAGSLIPLIVWSATLRMQFKSQNPENSQ